MRTNRFSTRIAGYLLAATTILGMIPAVSFAELRAGHSSPQSAGNRNPDVLPINAQPNGRTGTDDQRGNRDPGVYPPGSKPYGLTYGEWSARWWERILAIPPADNPNLDTTGKHCAERQSGPVWFLAGTFGGSASRTCTIRTGLSILIPILTTAFGAGLGDCRSPGWGNAGPCDVDALRASAAAEENNPRTLELSLDGVHLLNLTAYRAKSPEFSYTVASDNIVSYLFNFSVPAGTYHPAVADGYWVMFTPLPPGVHHTHATGVEAGGLTVDVDYTLIVQEDR